MYSDTATCKFCGVAQTTDVSNRMSDGYLLQEPKVDTNESNITLTKDNKFLIAAPYSDVGVEITFDTVLTLI